MAYKAKDNSEEEIQAENFSENLEYLLQKNNMKNIELANYLKKSKGAISNYTNGRIPGRDTLRKIASLFGYTSDDLLDRKLNTADDEYIRTDISVNEKGVMTYNVPLFHKQILSDLVIYTNENYLGIITSPIPLEEDLDCYAIKAYDDSMKSCGIAFGSLVIFSAATEAKNGDIAVVLIKSKKQLYIRSVKKTAKEIELYSDTGKETYKITRDDCDAVVLGSVCSASFCPNK